MNHDIYHLRHVSLDPKLALQLNPIISAYRPHDPIPTKDELGEKVIPVDSEFSMKNLCKDIGKEYKPKKKT
jgi:hypothetical protein